MIETTAITTQQTTTLANKKLATQVTAIISNALGVAKCNWSIAGALYKILSEELYKDDFKSLKDFYEFIGIGEATCIQYKKAYEFMKKHGYLPTNEKGKVLYNEIPTTIGIAYLLSTLESKGELEAFTAWLEGKTGSPEVLDYTADALKKLIKEFREGKEDVKEGKKGSKKGSNKEGNEEGNESNDKVQTYHLNSKADALEIIFELMVLFDITKEEITEPAKAEREKVKKEEPKKEEPKKEEPKKEKKNKKEKK